MKQEIQDKIVRGLRETWEAIGEECLKLAEGVPMTAEEVREVAADASFGMYAPEACRLFRELEKEDKAEVLKSAFPDSRYGY